MTMSSSRFTDLLLTSYLFLFLTPHPALCSNLNITKLQKVVHLQNLPNLFWLKNRKSHWEQNWTLALSVLKNLNLRLTSIFNFITNYHIASRLQSMGLFRNHFCLYQQLFLRDLRFVYEGGKSKNEYLRFFWFMQML